MKDPYSDIDTWTWDQLKNEEEAIYTDFNSGLMSYEDFEKIYGIVNAELKRRRTEEHQQVENDQAYRRAMGAI